MERTITARQGATPLKIGFTFQRLLVTECVPRLAAKCHQSAHIEVIAVPLAIDGYPRIHAVIWL